MICLVEGYATHRTQHPTFASLILSLMFFKEKVWIFMQPNTWRRQSDSPDGGLGRTYQCSYLSLAEYECWLTTLGECLHLSQKVCSRWVVFFQPTIVSSQIEWMDDWTTFLLGGGWNKPIGQSLYEPNAIMHTNSQARSRGSVDAQSTWLALNGAFDSLLPTVGQLWGRYKWFSLLSWSFPRWSETRGFFLLLLLLFLRLPPIDSAAGEGQ